MNGLLWFLAPYLLIAIPVLIGLVIVVAVRSDWGRPRVK